MPMQSTRWAYFLLGVFVVLIVNGGLDGRLLRGVGGGKAIIHGIDFVWGKDIALDQNADQALDLAAQTTNFA